MNASILAFLLAASAAEPITTPLVDGVVVGKDRTYVMGEDGVVAVDIASGKPAWTSSNAIKPVALSEGRLVVLGAVNDQAGVAVLDARNGEVAARCGTPSGVGQIQLIDGLGSNNSSGAWRVHGGLVVTWSHDTFYSGGMAPTPEMEAASRTHSQGALTVDIATGCVTQVAMPEIEAPKQVVTWTLGQSGPWHVGDVTAWLDTRDAGGRRSLVLVRKRRRKDLPEVEVIGGNTGYLTASVSADGTSVMASVQRVEGQGQAVYDWVVAALDTGEVQRWDGQGFPAPAWTRRGGLMVVSNGGAVMGITGDGDVAWTHGVRATGYNGPYPP